MNVSLVKFVNPSFVLCNITKGKIRQDIYFSFQERILTIIEHAGSNNIAREGFVEVAIIFLIALVHLLEVSKQRLAGNSEPVSLDREIPRLEARYL